jgi:hypothetical protein
VYAQTPPDSIQFIQVEAFGGPGIGQRLERHVQADLVPEPEAIRCRAGGRTIEWERIKGANAPIQPLRIRSRPRSSLDASHPCSI